MALPLIRNIWAVGRNYGEHAKELGNAVPSADDIPLIFLKAGSSIVENKGTFRLPNFSADVHHECEVAFRFGADLQFSEVSIALDLTARDIQNRLKDQKHPWTLAKSFKNATLLGPLVPIRDLAVDELIFNLAVNGEVRQRGNTADMIFSPSRLREYIVSRFPVCEGDLVLTGTPAGVGPLKPGDRIAAEIPTVLRASWEIERT